ncbi:MAG: uridine kinase [Planctomycetaceae bacterium]
MTRPQLLIGIAGGSGSGKSTVADHLCSGPWKHQICRLSHDAWYHDLPELPRLPDGSGNWDHPDSLENSLLLQQLDQLMLGHSIQQPVYDYATHRRLSQTKIIQPAPVILLEGILLFAIPALCEKLQLRIFVDTPADLRLLRRTLRDTRERGRSLQSVATQYELTVRPMHEAFVEPSRAHAHLCLPWISENQPAIDTLNARIAAAIHTR